MQRWKWLIHNGTNKTFNYLIMGKILSFFYIKIVNPKPSSFSHSTLIFDTFPLNFFLILRIK